MYDYDQARIESWCKNPDKLVDVGTMVLLSIRMQWVGVGNQMADVRKHGAKSKCLWGFKREGYEYLRENKLQLYSKVRDYRAVRLDLQGLMREFLKVPGLGLPKAGFLCQLVVGASGCLDMHNIERFDLKPKVWLVRTYRDTAKQVREIEDKIDLYLSLVDLCGGTEVLWDEWCEYLASKVSTFYDADDVSRRHYEYLIGERT